MYGKEFTSSLYLNERETDSYGNNEGVKSSYKGDLYLNGSSCNFYDKVTKERTYQNNNKIIKYIILKHIQNNNNEPFTQKRLTRVVKEKH